MVWYKNIIHSYMPKLLRNVKSALKTLHVFKSLKWRGVCVYTRRHVHERAL